MQETMDDVLLAAGDKMIDKAREAGNFFNFTATVHNGKVDLELSGWEFPPDDLLNVAHLIVSALAEEYRKAKQPKPDPLPLAGSLKLLRDELRSEDQKMVEPVPELEEDV